MQDFSTSGAYLNMKPNANSMAALRARHLKAGGDGDDGAVQLASLL